MKRSRDQSQDAPKPLELVDDRAAGMLLPFPDAPEKLLSSKLAAARFLLLQQLPLDKALRRDAGMIRAWLPQHIAPAHAVKPRQHILQRVVQRMPHVKRARDVRRRDHDSKGLCFRVFLKRASGAESLRLIPALRDARFDGGVVVSFFKHDVSGGTRYDPVDLKKDSRPATANCGCGAGRHNLSVAYSFAFGESPRVAISSRIALSRMRGMFSFSHCTSIGRNMSRTASSSVRPPPAGTGCKTTVLGCV